MTEADRRRAETHGRSNAQDAPRAKEDGRSTEEDAPTAETDVPPLHANQELDLRAHRRHPLHGQAGHARARRALAAPGEQRLERTAIALGLQLDASVGSVPHPADHPEPGCLHPGASAKPDALHATLHECSKTLTFHSFLLDSTRASLYFYREIASLS